jgi:hypothetical protein
VYEQLLVTAPDESSWQTTTSTPFSFVEVVDVVVSLTDPGVGELALSCLLLM